MEPQQQYQQNQATTQMHTSSSTQRIDVPEIRAGPFGPQDTQQSINRMLLEEQASQTLKFAPSKEAMTVTNLRSHGGGAPPLPNNQHATRGGRPLNSERGGTRTDQNPLLSQHQSVQMADNVFYQNHPAPSSTVDQHYHSTSIEQNVMMFDNTDGQQNLQMSSAFDHIQDELTKLNDQLNSGDQPNPNVPKSTKAGLTKKNRSNSRLVAAGAGANQNGGKRQSSSRSASRSRQTVIMNRLAQGQATTVTSTAQTSSRQNMTGGGSKIRTHARLNSTGAQQRQIHATQSSHRSLHKQQQPQQRRKQSCSSINTGNNTQQMGGRQQQQHRTSRSRRRLQHQQTGYDTIQQPQHMGVMPEQRLGKPRSQRSFSNLPMRRLSRGRSRSTKALISATAGGSSSGGHQTKNSLQDHCNMTQQPNMMQQHQFYSQKTQQTANRTYVFANADNASMIVGSPADQTIMAAISNHNQAVPDSSLVNIVTAPANILGAGGEPPQYLLASCENDDHIKQSAMGSVNNANTSVGEQQNCSTNNQNHSTSQIEQIMARYEQLCKKLDSQQQMPQDHLIVNQEGQIVFDEGSAADRSQQQFEMQQNDQQHYEMTLQPRTTSCKENNNNNNNQESLDMYIAQHEESMLQESTVHQDRQQTLDSPARHIGPREYIEQQIILSNGQTEGARNLKNHQHHQTGSFQPTSQYQENDNSLSAGGSLAVEQEALAELQSRMLLNNQMESEIGLAENHLGVTASQFNQLSQVTDTKEGTSHFQGIALTTSELNGYQDSQACQMQQAHDLKETDGVYDDEENKENDDQQNHIKASIKTMHNENLISQHSHQAPNTQQTSKHGYNGQQLRSAALSGQNTHGQASVTSYNTADFTKLSINQQDILSNQKSSKGVQQQQAVVLDQKTAQIPQRGYDKNSSSSAAMEAMQKLQERSDKLQDGLRTAMQIILQLSQQLSQATGNDVNKELLEMEHVEELDTVDSVVDLLTFMRNDKRNLLVRNPQIQHVMQNSLQLFPYSEAKSQQKTGGDGLQDHNPSVTEAYTNQYDVSTQAVPTRQQTKMTGGFPRTNSSMTVPISESDSKVLLQLDRQSSSEIHQTGIAERNAAAHHQQMLTMFSTSMVGGQQQDEEVTTSPPAQQRCATEMSALIGSPVGVLDLSAVNQFSQQTTSNVKNVHQQMTNGGHQMHAQQLNPINCFTNQQIHYQQEGVIDNEKQEPISLDTVKLVGVADGTYNQVKPFEAITKQKENHKAIPNVAQQRPTHDRVNSQQHIASAHPHQQMAQADGQLLTLRNQKIFEADESNIFSQTMSPNHENLRRQANMVTHLFSQEEESSISHQKTSGRQQTNQQLNSCQENATNTGRGASNGAELSFDSVFSKEPLARRAQQQQQQSQNQQLPQVDNTATSGAFQGYSPVILNKVSEISPKQPAQQINNHGAAQYTTATFVGATVASREGHQSIEDQSSVTETSSARSSVFNAANQSLSQQELTDIMFASVRNPAAKLGGYGGQQAQARAEEDDDGSNVGILTAMAQKRRNVGGAAQLGQNAGQRADGNDRDAKAPVVAAAPWKSLNLSKINQNDQNNRDRFAAPVISSGTGTNHQISGGAAGNMMGQQQHREHMMNHNMAARPANLAENRRHKGYNNEGGEADDDLEEASRILTLDDFAPNFISQKPFSPPPQQNNAPVEGSMGFDTSANMMIPQPQQQNHQTLVSFRRMTNRVEVPEPAITMQSQSSSHAERVAAALIMSSGPTEDEQYSDTASSINVIPPGVVVPSLTAAARGGADGMEMTSLEDARSKFLGGYTSLKSEISQLKQTILNND